MYGNGTQTILGYDAYGFPASHLVATGGVLNLNYGFDPATGNLNWRNDHTYRLNLSEDFSYDEYALHNRLTGWGESDQEQFSILYNPNGNIRCKTDISVYSPFAFQYSPTKPHAITQVYDITEDYKDFVEGQDQDIGYNAFDKTDYIEQGNKRIEFVYGPDLSRKIMKTYENEGGNFVLKKTKYYILGNTEIEVDHQTGETRTLSYIANKAIWEQNAANGNQLYYLHQDYQGSLLAVTDENGDVVQRYAYDPWGRRRDPGSWHNLTASEIEQENFLFARGYTGHEHLDAFGLINMNGRMYDPLLGRMLSPDNYVQAPDNSQNFNRYSYALNNPLVYTDPSGEFLVPMLIGSAIGLLSNGYQNSLDDLPFFQGAGKAALFGAIGGAASFGIGQMAGQLSQAGVSNFGVSMFQMGAHGLSGGLTSHLSGGKFAHGFFAGGVSSGLSSIAGEVSDQWTVNLAAGAIGGGIGAEIAGGDFADGVRQGLITGGLNHVVHSGMLGPNIAAASVTGRTRHLFGPDAIALTGTVDIALAASIDGEVGKLTILRGSDQGSFPLSDFGIGVGFGVSIGGEIVNLYSSASRVIKSHFYGIRAECNLGVAIAGIGVGVTGLYSKHSIGNGFTIGYGMNVSIGMPFPVLINGNINYGYSGETWREVSRSNIFN
jgi:RHS repeat-associated protein